MYKYLLNSVVQISMMFAKYFEYYTIILRGGRFFVDMLHIQVRTPGRVSGVIKVKLSNNYTHENMQYGA